MGGVVVGWVGGRGGGGRPARTASPQPPTHLKLPVQTTCTTSTTPPTRCPPPPPGLARRLRYEVRPRFVLLGSVAPDIELYLAMDPLTNEAEATSISSTLADWLRARHDLLFGC